MAQKTSLKLTQDIVQKLKYDATVTTNAQGRRIEPRCVRWDTEVRGLGIRVYPSGKKAWVLSYTVESRKRLMQLGTFPSLTLDAARKVARSYVGDMAKAEAFNASPVDPLAERQMKNEGATVAALVEAFLTQHAEAKRKPRTAAEYRRQLHTHVLPIWGNRRAEDIKHSDVAALHSRIGQNAPTQANRTVAAISKMFSFAKGRGYVAEDKVNPAAGTERFKEQKRDRWVSPGELPRLVDAVNAEPHLIARAAIWLFLLTGARRTELLKSKWEDVDFERRELRFPEENTKAGRVHYVPLSPAAINVLSGIPRVKDNPYILPGSKEGHHLVNIDKPWRRIRKAAGMEDVRIHDLRRTVGSWLATNGESLPLIGKVLNHADVKTTAIYARLAEDPARRAMEDYGKQIMEVAKGIRIVK